MTIRKDYDMLGSKEPGLRLFQFGQTHSSPDVDVLPALLGTSAVPWLYGPVRYQNIWLSDGGLLANLPGDIVKNLNVDAFVEISPSAPSARPSLCPVSRRIRKNMRRRLALLKGFADTRRQGAVPVYHLHPGLFKFKPPGMLNFGRQQVRQSFLNGYQFGQTLAGWTSSLLGRYRI